MTGRPPEDDLDRARLGLAGLGALGPDRVKRLLSEGIPLVEPQPSSIPADASAAAADPRRQFGPYLQVEEIGKGGMGRVWRAWDRGLHRWVALKVLRDDVTDAARPRFLREARAAARLRHPNIVAVHNAGEIDNRPYIVMELVEGRPLEAAGSLRVVAGALRKVALALDEAHRQGVVHRDLKPANILIDAAGEPRVVDFGLAQVEDGDPRLTRSGSAIGTPLYMAPEQVSGDTARIGPRTDVYALGIILYEALAGRPPHVADSLTALYTKILDEDAPVPPGPPDLATVCLRAIAKEPQRRYPSAAKFAEDLGRWLQGEPVSARPPSLLYRISRRLRRHRLAGAGAVALLLFAVMGSAVWRMDAESDRRRAVLDRVGPVAERIQQARAFHYVEEVDIRAKLREIAGAIDDLQALAGDPGNAGIAELWSAIGTGAYLVGDPGRAEEALQRAEAAAPGDGRVLFQLARIHLDRSLLALIADTREEKEARREESRRWAEKARELLARPSLRWTGAAEVDRHVAAAYRAHVEKNGAELQRLCAEGIERYGGEPGAEEYWNLIGLDAAGALRIQAYDRAIARRPHYAWGRFMRGTALAAAGERDKAVADFDRALEMHPRFVPAHFNRANVLAELDRPEEAVAAYGELLRLDPGHIKAWINRAALKLQLNDLDGAIADCSEAIRLDPSRANAWYSRALARGRKGEQPAAVADLRKALEVAPPDWAPRQAAEKILRDLGQDH